MSNPSSLQEWYCANTTAGREKSLQAALTRIGVETFLPLKLNHRQRLQYVHEKRDHEPRHYTSHSAFFPGYLFALMGEHEWARAKLQLGIRVRLAWVNFGQGPVRIPAEIIEELRAGLGSSRREYPKIQDGQGVKVIGGPLAGLSGVFSEELSGPERVSILMTVLGALRPITVQRCYVELAE